MEARVTRTGAALGATDGPPEGLTVPQPARVRIAARAMDGARRGGGMDRIGRRC